MQVYKETKFKKTEIGRVPMDWEVENVGGVVENIIDNRGKNPSEYLLDGIPVIDNFMIKNEGYVDLDKAKRFISEETYKNFIRKYNRQDDVLITLVGNNYGNVSLSPKSKCVIIQNTIGLRSSSNIFLYYVLFISKKKLINLNRGAAQPSIRVDDILKIKIPLPTTLNEQKNIAKILSDLDEKIENNKKINENLEEIGKTIFKRWFVDFEFPDEKGKPYKSNGGKMKYSQELEKNVPEEWEVGKIGDELNTILGGTPSRNKKEYWDNGKVSWINSGKISEFPILNESKFITNEALKNSAAKLMPIGTVVLPFVISVGKEVSISVLGIQSCGNQSVLGILPNEKFISEFIYLWIQERKNKIYSAVTGGAQQHINKNEIEKTELLIPEKEILESFNNLIKPIFNQILENSKENQKLQEIRDYLLPKLMKGEIRIKE